MANKSPNLKNLKPFVKGPDPRRWIGRPRKAMTQLKSIGYTNAEIACTFLSSLALTEDELKQIADDESLSALERTVSKAILRGLERSSLYNIESIITRAIGKPKESVDLTTGGEQLKYEITLKL